MYLTRTTFLCTRTTVAASTFSTQYSTEYYTGMFHSVTIQAKRALAGGSIWIFNERSTDQAVLKVAAPSTLVHEYHPRRTVYLTSAQASTAGICDKLAFANDRMLIHVSASSDWHGYSTAGVALNIYWEGPGPY